ncbi:hypothetical protein DPMN_175136 [Dreissena polymorpha]|uniref:Uncharacterized protein n=1 Tax=Dreissena polymorpha TaxID=45954 RepID=A0A9D4E5Z8_DREPO|nr:hypothetical protein DPMN_175136 [Dreissena polymorpha]
MLALKVDRLYLLSYSKESMVVLRAEFYPEPRTDIHREIELLSDKPPTTLSSSLSGIKRNINEYNQSKVTLVAEVKSKTAIPCEHKTESSINNRVYHAFSTANTVVTGVTMSDLLNVYLRCSTLIESCHNLCVKKASEVLVFQLGDLDKFYKPEVPHANPVAYAFRGYSMKTEVMRKMIQDVIFALLTNGLYIPVISFDGKWAKLAFQTENSTALTILDVQRQVYNKFKTKRVSELTKRVFETGVVKVDSFERLVQDGDVQIAEVTRAVYLGVKNGTRLFRASGYRKTSKGRFQEANTSSNFEYRPR